MQARTGLKSLIWPMCASQGAGLNFVDLKAMKKLCASVSFRKFGAEKISFTSMWIPCL